MFQFNWRLSQFFNWNNILADFLVAHRVPKLEIFSFKNKEQTFLDKMLLKEIQKNLHISK